MLIGNLCILESIYLLRLPGDIKLAWVFLSWGPGTIFKVSAAAFQRNKTVSWANRMVLFFFLEIFHYWFTPHMATNCCSWARMKSRNEEIPAGLPHGWQGFKNLDPLLLFRSTLGKLDQRSRGMRMWIGTI